MPHSLTTRLCFLALFCWPYHSFAQIHLLEGVKEVHNFSKPDSTWKVTLALYTGEEGVLREIHFKKKAYQGRYYGGYRSGLMETGRYRKGKLCGKVEQFYGARQGKEKRTLAIHRFRKGLLQGRFMTWFKTGNLHEKGRYRKDQLHGQYLVTSKPFSVHPNRISGFKYSSVDEKFKVRFKKGKMHGRFKSWNANGRPQIKGRHYHGLPHGHWVEYNKNWYNHYSSKRLGTWWYKKYTYHQGVLHGPFRTRFFANRHLQQSGRYRHGMLHGQHRRFSTNHHRGEFYRQKRNKNRGHQLISRYQYDQGKKHGSFRVNHPNGNKFQVGHYQSDSLHGSLRLFKEKAPGWRSLLKGDRKLQSTLFYVNGVKDGPFEFRYKRGRVIERGRHYQDTISGPYWVKDRKSGLRFHYPNYTTEAKGNFEIYKGQRLIKKVIHFEEPGNSLTMTFHRNGQLKQVYEQRDYLLTDSFQIYYPNGSLQVKGKFTADAPDGEWLFYRPDQSLLMKGSFEVDSNLFYGFNPHPASDSLELYEGRGRAKFLSPWVVYDKKGVVIKEVKIDPRPVYSIQRPPADLKKWWGRIYW